MALAGRLDFSQEQEPYVISFNMDVKSLSRSQKPRMCPLVQRSTKNPGFTDKGLAQHFARVLVVEVCEADLRFWKAKLGTLNHSNAAKF